MALPRLSENIIKLEKTLAAKGPSIEFFKEIEELTLITPLSDLDREKLSEIYNEALQRTAKSLTSQNAARFLSMPEDGLSENISKVKLDDYEMINNAIQCDILNLRTHFKPQTSQETKLLAILAAERWLRIAEICEEQRNFYGFHIICQAIMRPQISRLLGGQGENEFKDLSPKYCAFIRRAQGMLVMDRQIKQSGKSYKASDKFKKLMDPKQPHIPSLIYYQRELQTEEERQSSLRKTMLAMTPAEKQKYEKKFTEKKKKINDALVNTQKKLRDKRPTTANDNFLTIISSPLKFIIKTGQQIESSRVEVTTLKKQIDQYEDELTKISSDSDQGQTLKEKIKKATALYNEKLAISQSEVGLEDINDKLYKVSEKMKKNIQVPLDPEESQLLHNTRGVLHPPSGAAHKKEVNKTKVTEDDKHHSLPSDGRSLIRTLSTRFMSSSMSASLFTKKRSDSTSKYEFHNDHDEEENKTSGKEEVVDEQTTKERRRST